MNELKTTFFQIKPEPKKYGWDDDRVVFMNDAFDLDLIKYITAVYKRGNLLFLFDVLVGEKLFVYEFEQKSTALKAQRELTRAWTKTGEFAYVEEPERPAEPNMG